MAGYAVTLWIQSWSTSYIVIDMLYAIACYIVIVMLDAISCYNWLCHSGTPVSKTKLDTCISVVVQVCATVPFLLRSENVILTAVN